MTRYAVGNQDPLLHVPGARTGLWRVVRIAGTDRVDDSAWKHRASTGQHVGTCIAPGCGGPLLAGPDPPDTSGTVTTYPARCTSCDHEVVGLGPRPRQKKTRRR